MFTNKHKSLVHALSRRHCHYFSRTWMENYISGALLQCSLTVLFLLILLWLIFVNFSFTAPATTSSTNNLTQVVIVTVVKVLQNSCFLTLLVNTISMEQGLLKKLIVIYVLEQFPSVMECEGSLLFS